MDWHKVVETLRIIAKVQREEYLEECKSKRPQGLIALSTRIAVAEVMACALEAGLVDSAKPSIDGEAQIMPVGN